MLQRTKPHDLIAVKLRVAWSDVVTERLPDRLRRLLEQLAHEEETQQEETQRRGSGEGRPNVRKRHH